MTRRDRWRHSTCLAGGVLLAFAGSASAGETTFERLLGAGGEPNNWLTHHGDYASQRFSTLDEIDKENVGDLKVAWTYALGGIEGGGIWPHGGGDLAKVPAQHGPVGDERALPRLRRIPRRGDPDRRMALRRPDVRNVDRVGPRRICPALRPVQPAPIP